MLSYQLTDGIKLVAYPVGTAIPSSQYSYCHSGQTTCSTGGRVNVCMTTQYCSVFSRNLCSCSCTGYFGYPCEKWVTGRIASASAMEDVMVFGGGEAARGTLSLS